MTRDNRKLSNCTITVKLFEIIAKKTKSRHFSSTASTTHAQNNNRKAIIQSVAESLINPDYFYLGGSH